MSNRELIAQSAYKKIYREENKVVKVFAEGFPKSEVLNEALNTARVEETGLNVGKILEVSVVDGAWAITKEYIEGTPLDALMKENPDKAEQYMDRMADLHIQINSYSCPLLNRMKEKMTRQIQELDMIDEATRYELLTRLDGMPKHYKLCHGDFEPSNIIVQGDDMYVIDWVHATQGNASADVARTYLLLSLNNPFLADLYMDKFCEKTNTEKRYVQQWLPIVAAAQLTKKRPQEKDLLMKWVDVCEYQ